MKHTCILSSFNRPKMVRQAIASVLVQGGDWELIVTDDGSDQETLAAIWQLTRDDRRCEVLMLPHWKRHGVDAEKDVPLRAIQRINDALPHATGDIFHYLPDDDWFAVGRFVAFDDWFKKHPDKLIAYGRLFYVEGERVLREERFPPGPRKEAANHIDHGQFAHRRQLFETIPKWPEVKGNFAFDSEFFAAVQKHGHVFHPMDALVSYKRRHPLNLLETKTASTSTRE